MNAEYAFPKEIQAHIYASYNYLKTWYEACDCKKKYTPEEVIDLSLYFGPEFTKEVKKAS